LYFYNKMNPTHFTVGGVRGLPGTLPPGLRSELLD
jgi:hypothetical protein